MELCSDSYEQEFHPLLKEKISILNDFDPEIKEEEIIESIESQRSTEFNENILWILNFGMIFIYCLLFFICISFRIIPLKNSNIRNFGIITLVGFCVFVVILVGIIMIVSGIFLFKILKDEILYHNMTFGSCTLINSILLFSTTFSIIVHGYLSSNHFVQFKRGIVTTELLSFLFVIVPNLYLIFIGISGSIQCIRDISSHKRGDDKNIIIAIIR